MFDQLSQRDKRALKLGTIAVALIIVYLVIAPWLESWKLTRIELAKELAALDSVVLDSDGAVSAKQAGLLSIVPKFEIPLEEKEQLRLFRGRFNEQLKKAGVKIKSLQVMGKAKGGAGGYKKLRLQCKGKCNLAQAMDLLAALYDNPYFAGVEELQLKCDAKKRQEVEIVLTVSTLAK